MLSAKRASVAPPANSTGLGTRRAAARAPAAGKRDDDCKEEQRRERLDAPVTKSAATGLSQRRKALSGQSSQLSNGCRSTKRIGRVANAVSKYPTATSARSSRDPRRPVG